MLCPFVNAALTLSCISVSKESLSISSNSSKMASISSNLLLYSSVNSVPFSSKYAPNSNCSEIMLPIIPKSVIPTIEDETLNTSLITPDAISGEPLSLYSPHLSYNFLQFFPNSTISFNFIATSILSRSLLQSSS